jgi:hypothetical protein
MGGLRGILGSEREEVTGEWRKLHNEELNDLYCSHNIVRVIKWRRMRWAGHVARMGQGRVVYSDASANENNSFRIHIRWPKSSLAET